MKTIRLCIVASLLGLVGVCYSQNVSNVEATQSGRRIIISYDLDKLANIIVCYSTDQGKTFSPSLKAVSGDVGDNISPGHKSITWSPLDEFESFVAKGCIFKVLAALPGENVLLYLDNKPIYRSEFQYLYEKNKTEETPYSVDEYLELFVNFRLKVCEAEHRGYQLTSAFEEEYKKYCEGAYSKLYDHAALDSLIAISYEHMRVDRRAAHIAVECPQSADKSTEALAMKKISQARDRVVKGHESFNVVARDVSTDPQVNETGGELGWITPFRYVYPLEEAVYGTPIGSVSNVFRTQYGFHIVLVEEEREHEEVKASHIMKMAPQDDETKKEEARKQIFAIYNRLKRGANFSEVAKDESDDKGSASRGGDLGWFGRGMMVPAFENVAFGMVKQGDISYPFETQYGWHVVQFGGRRTILPFNELYDQIVKQVLRDERGQIAYSVLLSKVRNMRSLPKSMSDDDVKNYMLNELSLEEQLSLCPEYFQLTREYYEGILLLEIFNSEQSNYFEANRTKFVDKSDKRSFLELDKETAKRVSEAYNNSDRENVFLKSLKNKYSIVLNSAQIDFLKSIYR